MKKNIVYITGNDSYGVDQEIKRWIDTFEMKYGEINIDRYDLSDDESLKWIGEMLFMGWLFSEKRLFIFRGGRDRKSKAPGMEEILEKKYNDIPDDHFLLFHNIWEKEEGLIAWLSKNSDIRNIDSLWNIEKWKTRFDINQDIIRLVIDTYKNDEKYREKGDFNRFIGHDIFHTLETIYLLESDDKKLQKDEIIDLCHWYVGATVFSIVDAILDINIPLALDLIHRINANDNEGGRWLSSVISNLGNHLTIKFLKYHWCNQQEINKYIKIHSFVLGKWFWSRIWYAELRKIHKKLVDINIAYKTGKWLKDIELWRILSIELALLDLQKCKNL